MLLDPRSPINSMLNSDGYTVLVLGRPGTGKTTFALSSISWKGKKSLYINSRLSSVQLFKDFPWAEELLEPENIITSTIEADKQRQLFSFLELPKFMETMMETLTQDKEIDYIIIDSLEGVTHNCDSEKKREIENELILLSHKFKKTVLIISEKWSIEDAYPLAYLVDGVISLSTEAKHNNNLRILEIIKARRTRISRISSLFTLSEGKFNLCPPFSSTAPPILIPPKPITDLDDDHISTGCTELDNFIGDGFTVGSTYLFYFAPEARDARSLLEVMVATNHLNLGRTIKRIDIPDRNMSKDSVLLNGIVENLEKLEFRVPRDTSEQETKILPSKPKDLIDEIEKELQKHKDKNDPLLYMIDIDLVVNLFGVDRAKLFFSEVSSLARAFRSVVLSFRMTTEESEETIIHYPSKAFRLEILHRSLLIRGIVPEKNYHHLSFETNKGSISIKLKEIV
ncbi:MAG: RAD55 family ATPase [Candidatus Kariarchaeaceae archaeon]